MLSTRSIAQGGNELLSMMSEESLGRFAPHCWRVSLSLHDPISPAHSPMSHALFIEEGVASVVKDDDEVTTEICLIGSEGLCGIPIVSGDGQWPYRTFVQADSLTGLCIDAEALREAMNEDAELTQLLVRAVHTTLIQIAEGLVSNTTQRLPQRLARWLLMYRDRCNSERMTVTHAFMALMVGAQRTGITNALHELQGAGLILSERSLVIIRDVEGLRAVADSSYGVPEAERARLRAE